MMRFRSIVPMTIVFCLAIPAHAANQHYAIRAESIAAAINGMGMQVAPRQVALLSDVVSTSTAPRLRVRSMDKLGSHRLMVRVECQNPEECLPFFVRVDLSADNQTQLGASGVHLQSSDSMAAGHSKPDAIKAGSPATLLLDGDHLHISLSVVCLENGAPGQKIRVAAGERRQIYLAEVINGKLLKGTL
jgi:hypothetical protein